MSSRNSPLVYNVTCTDANTEYSKALRSFASQFMIKARTLADLKISFVATESGSTYWTIPATAADEYIGPFGGVKTVYFQSPTAGTVVEIIEWA